MAQHPTPRPDYRLRNAGTSWDAVPSRSASRHAGRHAGHQADHHAAGHAAGDGHATAHPTVAAAERAASAAVPAAGQGPTRSALRKYGAMAWFCVILMALAIIPSIYSGLLTGSVKDPTGHLDQVPAAVVNQDEPATSQGEPVHLGEDLTEELVHPDGDSDNLNWRTMGADEAQEALESGDVLAVLTVPETFSAHAAGLSTGEAADAQQSTLRVQTNDGANIIMGTIARTIGETAAATVAEGIGEEYVQNVLLGVTDVHDGMQEATDGAGQVADGARDARHGADDLVVGIDQLADGSVTLNDGAGRLADGAAAASSGSQDLAQGTASVNEGAQQLRSGLGQMLSQTASLPDQTTALADGAAQVADGVGRLDEGTTALSAAADALADGTGQFAAGLDRAVAGAGELQDGAAALATGTAQVQDGAAGVQGGLEDLLAGYDALTDDQRKAALAELTAGAGQVTAGAGQSADGASTVHERLGALVGEASSGTGLSGLGSSADRVAGGAAAAGATVSDLADGVDTLADGADRVAEGARALATGSGALADGIAGAASGADALAAGTSSLDEGVGRLAASLPALASGAADLESGSTELSSGLAGADDGSRRLASGLGELSDGSGRLFTSLQDGTATVPSYTDADASRLGSVAALPVSADVQRTNEVPSYGYGLAPYFMSLALWVGALGYFLMRPAVRTSMIEDGRPLWRVMLRSMALPALMGAVQSLLMVSVFTVGLDMTPADGWGLAGFALLTSLTFMAINQALIALLGPPGRFFALILIVLQLSAAGGTYPVQTAPAFFQALHPWLPMTYAVESFRSLIAGGTIGVGHGIVVMVTWAAVALALLAVAVWAKARRLRSAGDGVQAVPAAA
ncbi:YhgE/Pip domain-containing protein [Citricoccus sp.]|uniref:YhgE/Pip domain-containing protein n=1 Tax=Citricoccus sp. TaxID=1978372 RepID=UPI002C3D61D8|nr:YhgE/Pip domain-containing protein [Citricoccus sp.]HRO94857.1 YhgE/Pip domain-containing protein [Citricoccus sp.]